MSDGKKSKQRAGQVHARFHGFAENANESRPLVKAGRVVIPDYAISTKWKAKDGNTDMATSVWPRDEDHAFVIADTEIHASDLEVLNEWADNERDD